MRVARCSFVAKTSRVACTERKTSATTTHKVVSTAKCQTRSACRLFEPYCTKWFAALVVVRSVTNESAGPGAADVEDRRLNQAFLLDQQ